MEARIFGITSFAFLTAWAAPAKIQYVDFRATIKTATIVIERESPAYAALEDSRTVLGAIEEDVIIGEVATVGRHLATLLVQREKDLRRKQFELSRIKPLVITSAIGSENSSKTATSVRVDHLAQMIQANSAQPSTRIAQIDDNEPMSVMGLAEILVRDELAKRAQTNTAVKKIETSNGNAITVSKPVRIIATALPKKENAPSNYFSPTPNTTSKPKRQLTIPSPKNPVIASNDKNPSTTSVPPLAQLTNLNGIAVSGVRVTDKANKQSRYYVRGPITFSGGAALLGQQDEIVVLHILDGLAVSEGSVNVSEARYALDVEDLAGEIQVQLRSQDGQVRALGSLNLYDVAQIKTNGAKIENQEITIRPIINGISGSVISAASFGKTVFNLSDAQLYIADLDRQVWRNKSTGLFEDKDVMIPSNAILKAQMKNFWPSLAYSESGRNFYMRLFPSSLIEALFEFTLDKYAARDAEKEAVVWGRVTYGGQAVEGAKVDLVGEEKSKAVYFTGFMPDKNLSHTSSRGEFAFTRLSADEKLLSVTLGKKIFWPVMVTLNNGVVFYADLEAEPTRTVEFRSYDALTAQPLPALMQPMGSSEEWPIDQGGLLRTKVDTLKGLTFVESQAGEGYSATRVMLRSGQTEVNIPQVEQQWLNKMRESLGLVARPESANTVVGFIEGEDFEVIVGAGENWQNKTIAYFNEKGEIMKDKRHGQIKGFVIFDLPSGLNTLTIVPSQSKRVIIQTVYADQFATHVLNLNLNY